MPRSRRPSLAWRVKCRGRRRPNISISLRGFDTEEHARAFGNLATTYVHTFSRISTWPRLTASPSPPTTASAPSAQPRYEQAQAHPVGRHRMGVAQSRRYARGDADSRAFGQRLVLRSGIGVVKRIPVRRQGIILVAPPCGVVTSRKVPFAARSSAGPAPAPPGRRRARCLLPAPDTRGCSHRRR